MNVGIVLDNELNFDNRVLREIRILKEQGFQIFVLCFAFRKSYDIPLEGINISRINIPRKFKNTLFFFQNMLPAYEWLWTFHIADFIKSNKIDVIHAHDLYMSRSAKRGIRRSGKNIPLILDLHENYPFQITTYNWTKGFLRNLLSRPAAWKKKESEYLGYADKIVVLSLEYRDSLISEYPQLSADRFAVFPNVPDISAREYTDKRKVENPFSNGIPTLLYYGVIAERRGIFETLIVFSELLKKGYEINLLLIGPVDRKDQDRFSELISTPDLKGKLRHIPWINPVYFPGYLEICDICLAPFRKNPQHESGIANKIYDYMLGGKPVIVSDCLPQKILVEKYHCGLVFSNEEEYKSAIIRLISDADLRSTLGRNGEKAIKDFYNVGNFREQLLSAYRLMS